MTEFFGQNIGQTYILTDISVKKVLTDCIAVAIVGHNFLRIGQNEFSTIVFLTDCIRSKIRSKKLFSVKIMAFFGQKFGQKSLFFVAEAYLNLNRTGPTWACLKSLNSLCLEDISKLQLLSSGIGLITTLQELHLGSLCNLKS